MDEQTPKIPNSADELINNIDSARAELATPQIINELKELARDMASSSPLVGDGEHERLHKTAHYYLLDNREVIVTDWLSDYTGGTNVSITIIEKITDENGQEHAIRKRYFVVGDGIELETDSFVDSVDKDISRSSSTDEYLGKVQSLTQEEVRAAYKQLADGRRMNLVIGVKKVTNGEIINLMRLLKTSEPITHQVK